MIAFKDGQNQTLFQAVKSKSGLHDNQGVGERGVVDITCTTGSVWNP